MQFKPVNVPNGKSSRAANADYFFAINSDQHAGSGHIDLHLPVGRLPEMYCAGERKYVCYLKRHIALESLYLRRGGEFYLDAYLFGIGGTCRLIGIEVRIRHVDGLVHRLFGLVNFKRNRAINIQAVQPNESY